MHYYPHHIGDFIRDTARLSDAQCMAYLRLIWAYYDTEKPLTDDPESLAFQIGSTADVVRQILSHYFQKTDDGWRHTRCDAVINDYHGKQDKARRSANARWNNADAMRTHTERNANAPKSDANQEPITNNQKKHTTAPSGLERRFEDFWKAYPRKVGKDAARRAFANRKPDDDLLGLMLSALNAQIRSPDWQSEGGRFIPHPATWLNQGRWQDVVEYKPADVARATVPAKQGPDPALQKIIEDRMKAVPPPADVREKLAALRGASG